MTIFHIQINSTLHAPITQNGYSSSYKEGFHGSED
jgi:hypothetical protein